MRTERDDVGSGSPVRAIVLWPPGRNRDSCGYNQKARPPKSPGQQRHMEWAHTSPSYRYGALPDTRADECRACSCAHSSTSWSSVAASLVPISPRCARCSIYCRRPDTDACWTAPSSETHASWLAIDTLSYKLLRKFRLGITKMSSVVRRQLLGIHSPDCEHVAR